MHPSWDPETLVTKLPYRVLDELSGYLDIPDASNKPYWKALIAVLPEDMYSDVQINRFSMEGLRLNGGSSALSLLRDLGNLQGKTVRQLASYLDRMHYEEALKLIKAPEDIIVTHNPISSSVVTGDVAKFSCKARGFPYPRYQWYRAYMVEAEGGNIIYEAVSGAVDSVLEISPVNLENAGGYCCKVYHIVQGQERCKITEWAYLTAIPVSAPIAGASTTSSNGQILAPPVIREEPKSEIRVNLGSELVLTCRATGTPKPQYQWYKYQNDPQTGNVTKEPIKGRTSEVMEFAQATLGDKGKYICNAYNSVGQAWSVTVEVEVQTAAQRLRQRCRIEILRHPVSVQCLPGTDRKLECVASCNTEKLFYQWYKDGKELPDEKSNQLCFRDMSLDDAGTYFCRVTAENGQYEESKSAALEFPIPKESLTATDKVALLIGNEAYRSGDQLAAPGNDMEKLANELYKLNFKVVSLLNLSVKEMRKALQIFCTLLDTGVYGLFFFSGHGFEQGGQTYMVPADAPTGFQPQECMCAEEVLEGMQNRNTALNVILLDICRRFNDYDQGPVQIYKPAVKGNTVFGYAAQCNSEAYEVRSHGYAVFTKYLVKRINEDDSIYNVVIKVMQDVKDDPDAGTKQFPAVMGTLRETRSLCDAIAYKGHTTAFSTRHMAWQDAHELPGNIVIDSLPLGIVCEIQFELRFSNAMVIITKILNKGCADWCEVRPQHFPPEVDFKLGTGSVIVRDPNGREEEMVFYRATIENIQRIRDDFNFDLYVNYNYGGQGFTHREETAIGRPLISKVWLLDDQLQRAPLENDEFSDSTSNSLL